MRYFGKRHFSCAIAILTMTLTMFCLMTNYALAEFYGYNLTLMEYGNEFTGNVTYHCQSPYTDSCFFDKIIRYSSPKKTYYNNNEYYVSEGSDCSYTNGACGVQSEIDGCAHYESARRIAGSAMELNVYLSACNYTNTNNDPSYRGYPISCTTSSTYTQTKSFITFRADCDPTSQKPTYIAITDQRNNGTPLSTASVQLNGISPVVYLGEYPYMTWKIPVPDNVRCGGNFTLVTNCDGHEAIRFFSADLEYVCTSADGSKSPDISMFSASPSTFNPSTGETTSFSWAISDTTGLSKNWTLSIGGNSWDVSGGSSFAWDGKDGRKRNLPPGTYTATLAANNSAGCSASKTFSVTIIAPAEPSPCLKLNIN